MSAIMKYANLRKIFDELLTQHIDIKISNYSNKEALNRFNGKNQLKDANAWHNEWAGCIEHGGVISDPAAESYKQWSVDCRHNGNKLLHIADGYKKAVQHYKNQARRLHDRRTD